MRAVQRRDHEELRESRPRSRYDARMSEPGCTRERLAAEALTAATRDGVRARVTGIVRALERTLHAPATGRACVAFSVRVTEPSRQVPNNFFDRVLAVFHPRNPKIAWGDDELTYVELAPFVIDDAQLGKVVIDSNFGELVGFEMVRPAKLHDRYWTDFVDDRGISPVATGIEAAVLEGATITVVGAVARRQAPPGAEAGYREAPTELCLVGDFDRPLLLADARGAHR